MATLTGRSWASHSYVTSSDGYAWECGGGTYGNINPICSGTANSSTADCISQGWRSMAGVVYGVTGVCHQASNRILYETGQKVWFWAFYVSLPLYGYYGSIGVFPAVAWYIRKSDCGVLLLPSQSAPRMISKEGDFLNDTDKRTHDFLQKLLILTTLNQTERLQLYGESKDPLADTGSLNQELKLWIKYRLGENFDERKLEEISKAQNLLFQNSLTARSNLIEEIDDPQKNAHDINHQLSVCLKRIKDILGEEDYQQVFETNDTDVTVVDPDIALDAYNAGVYRIGKDSIQ
jgi:hypothetical protein